VWIKNVEEKGRENNRTLVGRKKSLSATAARENLALRKKAPEAAKEQMNPLESIKPWADYREGSRGSQ